MIHWPPDIQSDGSLPFLFSFPLLQKLGVSVKKKKGEEFSPDMEVCVADAAQ